MFQELSRTSWLQALAFFWIIGVDVRFKFLSQVLQRQGKLRIADFRIFDGLARATGPAGPAAELFQPLELQDESTTTIFLRFLTFSGSGSSDSEVVKESSSPCSDGEFCW